MPRRQILTPAEYAAFDTPPVFSNSEREKFFHVGSSLESLLATLRTSTNQVCFLLTLGYFRATKRFFTQPFHPEDLEYVAGKLGRQSEQLDLEAYDKKATASRHRQLTLSHLGFQAFNAQARQDITQEIHTMVRSQMRPKAIFLNVLEILETRRTEIPSARTLTDLITEETKRHQRELTETLEAQLSPAQRELLDALLDKQETSIEALVFCEELSDAEKVSRIQAVLSRDQGQRHTAEAQLMQFKQKSQRGSEEADYYNVLASKSVKLQNRVAEIVKELEFQGDDNADLLVALQYYQQKGGTISQTAPVEFLKDQEQQAVVDASGKFRVSLYKALLFIKIAEALKAGALNLKHSYKYRSLDDYLIPKQAWSANKEAYLQRADLIEVTNCQRTVRTVAERLDQQYHQTNQRLVRGENPHVHFHKDGTFHVVTPKGDASHSQSLRGILPDNRYISLVEVLSTINHFTGFLDEFEPWHVKYARAKPPEKTFLAGILGYGCFIGIGKIAKISQWINESELENTVNWYFTLDNIQGANDRVLKLMDQLELPELYRRQPGVLHTSSDGQKFGVAVESLNANYSFKYFGKDQGVSAYTFIDERHFLWHHAVISAAEREAAYVIDGLMHNEVVKSDIHSTDTHGYSEIVFGTMHLLGFAFAPRIKNLKHQRLYAFRKRREYEQQGYKLLPDAYINTPLLEAQWEEILRFVATIKLKETSASQLFRRLNSYSKQHPLYRALKEFGKIPKSDFILRYIDDLSLRQAIEKQLNKGENANKFSRAIAFGNNQDFLYGEKVEQEIAEGCRRLIKNAIICWNYLYLSQKLAQEEDEERRQELLWSIRNSSVVTWHHINLHGEYDFSDDRLRDSVGLDIPNNLANREG